jgi:hypothetical protein
MATKEDKKIAKNFALSDTSSNIVKNHSILESLLRA